MYNFSVKFQNALIKDQRNFKIDMNVTLADNTQFAITEADIWSKTLKVEGATSGSGQFTVGAAVASKLTFSLNNIGEVFSEYNFIDAKINLQVGLYFDDGTSESVQYGVYTVTESSFSLNTITITALDNISKLSHENVGLTLPTTLEELAMACCSACSVQLDSSSVIQFMKSYTVSADATLGDASYVSIMSYIAQVSGCYLKATHDGKIAFGWYPAESLEETFDGGTFRYDGKTDDGESESNLDGGTFAFNDGDNADGGSLRGLAYVHILNSPLSATVDTDDISITGVTVTDSSEAPASVTVGNSGYVVEIKDNPLIQSGQAQTVAQRVFSVVGEMVFRPFTATILSDPSIEAGDVCYFSTLGNVYYPAFISSVIFAPDAESTVTCDAQSKNKQGSTNNSIASQIIQESKKWIAYEKSAREVALENMNNLMSNALGYFTTSVEQAGGGSITYVHNKPKLADSDTRWCFTEQGFMVSTDFGQTWRAGFDAQGNAVVNVLSAVGINADWIKAGTITGRKINNGNGTFLVDELGNVTANSLSSNNANITGGTININSSSSTADLIQLTYGSKATQISPVHFQISEGGESVTVTDESIIVNKTGGGGTSAIYHNKIMENNQYLSDKYTSTATYNAGIEGVYKTFSAYSEAINAKATKSPINGTYIIKADNAAKTTLATIVVSDGVITSISTNG